MGETNKPLLEIGGAIFKATLRSNGKSWQASYLIDSGLSDKDCAEGETQFFETKDEARNWLASAAKRRGFEKYDIRERDWA
jgi:hypothetical protein